MEGSVVEAAPGSEITVPLIPEGLIKGRVSLPGGGSGSRHKREALFQAGTGWQPAMDVEKFSRHQLEWRIPLCRT